MPKCNLHAMIILSPGGPQILHVFQGKRQSSAISSLRYTGGWQSKEQRAIAVFPMKEGLTKSVSRSLLVRDPHNGRASE